MFATDLHFSHLGLQQGGINTLAQDKYGFVWIGTNNGLIRYDGSTIVTYRHDPDDPQSITSDAVIALHYGNDGRLWLGSADYGAGYYNYVTDTFARLDTRITGPNVYRFYDNQSNKGVYAQTSAGLFYLGVNDVPELVLSQPYSESVLGMYSDASGTHALLETGQQLTLGQSPDRPESYRIIPKTLIQYWQTAFCPQLIRESTLAGGGSGLFYCLRDGKVVDSELNETFFQAGINLAQLQIYDLVEDTRGVIWVSSDLGLLQITDEELNIINSSGVFDGKSLSDNQLAALLAGQKQTVFIATQQQGLSILNPDDSGITYVNNLHTALPETAKNPCQSESKAEPVIWSTLQDSDGGLWLGNEAGLYYQPADAGSLQQLQYISGKQGNDAELCNILSLEEAAGKIWIGTQQGLMHYDKQNQVLARYTSRPDNRSHNGLAGQPVTALKYDPKRASLWVGTDQAGLQRVDLNSDQVQQFPYESNNSQLLPQAQMHSLYLDEINRLWIGSSMGLSLWNEDSNTFRTIRASDDPATLSDAAVYAIHPADQGKLWLGTGNGLNMFDTNRFAVEKRWFERDGLPNPVIYRIAAGSGGDFWLSTANGLSHFNPAKNSFRNFFPQHKMRSANLHAANGHRGKKAPLFLGGPAGLNIINLQTITDASKAHLPLITRVDVLDDDKKAETIRGLLTVDNVRQQLLSRHLRLNFTYPFFGGDELLQSRYRLLPVNDNWSDTPVGVNYVEYVSLQPGNYEFQLQADLVGNQVSRFQFVIEPYFWETPWFRGLILVTLFVLTIVLSIYLYQGWTKLSAEKMTQQHYRIVEHELRPHLYETKKHLSNLMQSPRLTIKDKQHIRFTVMPLISKSIDFIAELRTLVDLKRTVKQPKQLYMLEDVLDEVLLFFNDYQQRITIGEVEDLNILTHQDAVYLLVKNLISNAIKYSPDGKPVTLKVYRKQKNLVIECLDQGIGISKNKRKAIYEPYKRFAGEYKNINGQGIGLAIVRFIVHTYQGHIRIEDNQPQGCRFIVELKGVVTDDS